MNKFLVKGRVKEVESSIMSPVQSGLKMILATCSQSGSYKSPLFDMLGKRYVKVHDDYRSMFVNRQIKLGTVQTSAISSEVWVMSAVCMDEKGKLDKKGLEACVKKLLDMARYEGASLHISDLLYKEVPELATMLPEASINAGINLYLYKEPEQLVKRA